MINTLLNHNHFNADSLNTIASSFSSLINNNSALKAIGVSANSNSNILTIKSISPNGTSYNGSVSSGATKTLALSPVDNGYLTAVTGPLSANDITSFVINPTGTLAQTTNSEGYTINYTYDNLDRRSDNVIS